MPVTSTYDSATETNTYSTTVAYNDVVTAITSGIPVVYIQFFEPDSFTDYYSQTFKTNVSYFPNENEIIFGDMKHTATGIDYNGAN